MSDIWVLGDGQLGAMLKEAGRRLGIPVRVVDPADSEAAQRLAHADPLCITAEREHWPDTPCTRALVAHPRWLNAAAFATLADRQSQKSLFDQLGLPTAPWCPVAPEDDANSLRLALGGEFLLKQRRGGYDGRGQWRSQQAQDATLPPWQTEAIAERMIHFTTEVSLVGARNRAGDMVFYTLTENFHAAGILQISVMQPGRFAPWQAEAERCHARLMTHLGYEGVLAIEFFLTPAGLLINEVAPRVHNSGHWTQAGASISQFELHLRALAGLPLVTPQQPGCSVMVNLIGQDADRAALALPGTQRHWYGKQPRPGRKLGHLNFYHPQASEAVRWLQALPLGPDFEGSRAAALHSLAQAGAD